MMIKTNGNQKDSQIVNFQTKNTNPLLFYTVEYDELHPEETLRGFIAKAREMVAKFERNQNRLVEIEAEMQDLLHYIEIENYKPVPVGYKIYHKIAELRRERRACKNENDLLQPIYEHFHATNVLSKLCAVQGEVAKARSAVEGRAYGVRTHILDEYIAPKKPEPIGLNLLTGETAVFSDESEAEDRAVSL